MYPTRDDSGRSPGQALLEVDLRRWLGGQRPARIVAGCLEAAAASHNNGRNGAKRLTALGDEEPHINYRKQPLLCIRYRQRCVIITASQSSNDWLALSPSRPALRPVGTPGLRAAPPGDCRSRIGVAQSLRTGTGRSTDTSGSFQFSIAVPSTFRLVTR